MAFFSKLSPRLQSLLLWMFVAAITLGTVLLCASPPRVDAQVPLPEEFNAVPSQVALLFTLSTTWIGDNARGLMGEALSFALLFVVLRSYRSGMLEQAQESRLTHCDEEQAKFASQLEALQKQLSSRDRHITLLQAQLTATTQGKEGALSSQKKLEKQLKELAKKFTKRGIKNRNLQLETGVLAVALMRAEEKGITDEAAIGAHLQTIETLMAIEASLKVTAAGLKRDLSQKSNQVFVMTNKYLDAYRHADLLQVAGRRDLAVIKSLQSALDKANRKLSSEKSKMSLPIHKANSKEGLIPALRAGQATKVLEVPIEKAVEALAESINPSTPIKPKETLRSENSPVRLSEEVELPTESSVLDLPDVDSGLPDVPVSGLPDVPISGLPDMPEKIACSQTPVADTPLGSFSNDSLSGLLTSTPAKAASKTVLSCRQPSKASGKGKAPMVSQKIIRQLTGRSTAVVVVTGDSGKRPKYEHQSSKKEKGEGKTVVSEAVCLETPQDPQVETPKVVSCTPPTVLELPTPPAKECLQKAVNGEVEESSWEDTNWDDVTLPASKRATAEDDVILLEDKNQLPLISTPSVPEAPSVLKGKKKKNKKKVAKDDGIYVDADLEDRHLPTGKLYELFG